MPVKCCICLWDYVDHTYACNVNMNIDSILPEIVKLTKHINKYLRPISYPGTQEIYFLISLEFSSLLCQLKIFLAVSSKKVIGGQEHIKSTNQNIHDKGPGSLNTEFPSQKSLRLRCIEINISVYNYACMCNQLLRHFLIAIKHLPSHFNKFLLFHFYGLPNYI